MTEKKYKYYSANVGIDSDNALFLILPNSVIVSTPMTNSYNLRSYSKKSESREEL